MSAFEVRQSGGVQAMVCAPLEKAGFLNAFSMRPGGVSPMPAADLNLAFNEDDPSNVEENRRRFLRAAGLPSRPIVTARQVHSSAVIEVGHSEGPEREADALYTQSADLLLAVKTADCLPILIGDPGSGTSCGVHAGWRGAAANVIGEAIAALKAGGVRPDGLLAAMGPAACAECFAVGSDVAERFTKIGFAEALKPGARGVHLDLESVCARQLDAAGIPRRNIYRSARCTIHEERLFFSHRREGKLGRPVGRMISVIGRR